MPQAIFRVVWGIWFKTYVLSDSVRVSWCPSLIVVVVLDDESPVGFPVPAFETRAQYLSSHFSVLGIIPPLVRLPGCASRRASARKPVSFEPEVSRAAPGL